MPFCGSVSYLYAGEIASAFIRAVSRDGDGAPVFDCNGVVATVEEGLDTLRRLVPGARVRAGGDPLPFPAEDCDALLRAQIGDYGAISLEEGTAETLRAFEALPARRKGVGRFLNSGGHAGRHRPLTRISVF